MLVKADGLGSKKGNTVLWPYILLYNGNENIFPHLVSLVRVNERGNFSVADSLILVLCHYSHRVQHVGNIIWGKGKWAGLLVPSICVCTNN